jgi:CxxC-x17-CxxC domain-containing protein
MKKTSKRKTAAAAEVIAQPDNLSAAIGRIQQQLTFLEKKIDALIAQPSSGPSGSFRRDRGGRDNFRERSFTKAICAECHTECEVPFKPTGDRPVYCKDCFSKRQEGAGEAGRGSFKPRFDHGPREDRGFGGGKKRPVFRKRSRDRA